MGNNPSQGAKAEPSLADMGEYQDQTHFTLSEVQRMHGHFEQIAQKSGTLQRPVRGANTVGLALFLPVRSSARSLFCARPCALLTPFSASSPHALRLVALAAFVLLRHRLWPSRAHYAL